MSEVVLLPQEPHAPHRAERAPKELPPAESVPILKEYGRLGLNRFIDKYAIPTQLDERGFVDYGWLLGYIDSLVDKEYIWSSRLDVHHLQWESNLYDAVLYENVPDPTVPERFREIPFHKLLIPRQMHDLIHIVTLPPYVPEYDEMQSRLEAYAIAVSLFQRAKQTIEIEEQDKRLIPAPHEKYRDKTYDPVRRKLVEREMLLDRYIEFSELFQQQLINTSQQDVQDLLNLELLQANTVDPAASNVHSLDKAVRLNKQKQAIRPKIRWSPTKADRVA